MVLVVTELSIPQKELESRGPAKNNISIKHINSLQVTNRPTSVCMSPRSGPDCILGAAPPRPGPAAFPKLLKAMVVAPYPALLSKLAGYETVLSIWFSRSGRGSRDGVGVAWIDGVGRWYVRRTLPARRLKMRLAQRPRGCQKRNRRRCASKSKVGQCVTLKYYYTMTP